MKHKKIISRIILFFVTIDQRDGPSIMYLIIIFKKGDYNYNALCLENNGESETFAFFSHV